MAVVVAVVVDAAGDVDVEELVINHINVCIEEETKMKQKMETKQTPPLFSR